MSDTEISDRLVAILARPEFRSRWEDLWRHWVEKLFDWINDHAVGLTPGARLAAGLVCAVVIFWVLFQVAERYRHSVSERASGDVGPTPLPESLSDSELVERSRALAEAGHPREAATLLLTAVLRTLARRRRIPWNRAVADWDWVRRLGGSAGLSELTREAQALAYGPGASGDRFDRCWALAVPLLRAPL